MRCPSSNGSNSSTPLKQQGNCSCQHSVSCRLARAVRAEDRLQSGSLCNGSAHCRTLYALVLEESKYVGDREEATWIKSEVLDPRTRRQTKGTHAQQGMKTGTCGKAKQTNKTHGDLGAVILWLLVLYMTACAWGRVQPGTAHTKRPGCLACCLTPAAAGDAAHPAAAPAAPAAPAAVPAAAAREPEQAAAAVADAGQQEAAPPRALPATALAAPAAVPAAAAREPEQAAAAAAAAGQQQAAPPRAPPAAGAAAA